ncbi:hypothetical protein EEB14_47180 [Rhodococcus sp. WS4]|nr:hypothetical protein EEB14_47180 [Rhodococcus sp. WS4]
MQTEGDESLLEPALRNRIEAPHSCTGDACSTCKATLPRGTVHMVTWSRTMHSARMTLHAGQFLPANLAQPASRSPSATTADHPLTPQSETNHHNEIDRETSCSDGSVIRYRCCYRHGPRRCRRRSRPRRPNTRATERNRRVDPIPRRPSARSVR